MKRLMRVTYATDVDPDDPEYRGSFSTPFPDPGRDGRQIVGVDWAEHGKVTITYLINHLN